MYFALLQVLELIGTENVKLSTKEMNMIAQLVMKEEEMETIEKMNKVQKCEHEDSTQASKNASTANSVPQKTVTPIVDSSKIISDSKIPPIPPPITPKPDDSKKF